MSYSITPKPFVYETDRELVYVPNMPHIVSKKNCRHVVGSCVYLCEQFLTYDVDENGYRIIPNNAQCPYVKLHGSNMPCMGRYIVYNDKIMPLPNNISPQYTPYNNPFFKQR